jgi:MFS family permease
MLCIGHLADRAGRKRLYGGELAILIFATMGVVQASDGFMIQVPGKQNGNYNAAMDIYDWISWWRFMLGFGIGAEVSFRFVDLGIC